MKIDEIDFSEKFFLQFFFDELLYKEISNVGNNLIFVFILKFLIDFLVLLELNVD